MSWSSTCLDNVADMDDTLKEAIRHKLSRRKNRKVLTKRDLFGGLSEAVVLEVELFVVKDPSLDGLKKQKTNKTEATCAVWRQKGRSGVLHRQDGVKLAAALEQLGKSPPHGLFDVVGLNRT